MGLYFNQHEQLHHALETLPVRGATKSHKFKLLPLFVWTVLRLDYSKTVTATLLKGVLERVFHSANHYFSQKQKQEKSFKTRWSRRERLAGVS